jgi:hypothetical protein
MFDSGVDWWIVGLGPAMLHCEHSGDITPNDMCTPHTYLRASLVHVNE